MREVSLEALAGAVILPGIEKHLTPLLAYRGNLTLGRAHRLFNLVVSAMEHDASTADITQRLLHNPEHSQLCGPEKPVQHMGLCGILSRLEDNPSVLALVPHLSEYVRGLGGFRYSPTRVSPTTSRRREMGAGGWRVFVPKPRKVKAVKEPRRASKARTATRLPGSNLRGRVTESIVYPFLIHDGGKPEHDLLRRVNAAVPKHFPPEMRADICQDLIVGILTGEFPEDDLRLPAKEMTKRVTKMFPTKYGLASLDAEMPGTDGLKLIDTFSTEDGLWWEPEEEEEFA